MKSLTSVAAKLCILCCFATPLPAMAVDISRAKQATVTTLIGKKTVAIDGKPVIFPKQNVARRDQVISANAGSGAQIEFKPSGIGNLVGGSKGFGFKVTDRCFVVEKGTVTINGKEPGCVGKNLVHAKKSTFSLTRTEDQGYKIEVSAGEAIVTGDPPAIDPEYDITKLFPTLNPVIGFGSSAFVSNTSGMRLGEASGLILGNLNFFTPIYQSRAKDLVYSYTEVSSNFDGFWGVGTEIGYRTFNPSSQSITGYYVGYAGFNSSACHNSLVTAGFQWERNRLRFGASGGAAVNPCENSLSYTSLSVGVPVFKVGYNDLRLSFSPYVLAAIGNNYGGGRIALDVPASRALRFSLYGSYDALFDTVIGGRFTYRIPPSGRYVHDPNDPRAVAVEPGLVAQPGDVVIKEGWRGFFNSQGNLLRPLEPIPPAEFAQLILTNFKGFRPLPEGRRVAAVARRMGITDPEVAMATGATFLDSADIPVSVSVDPPFSPGTVYPLVPEPKIPRPEIERDPGLEPEPEPEPDPPEESPYDSRQDLPKQIVYPQSTP